MTGQPGYAPTDGRPLELVKAKQHDGRERTVICMPRQSASTLLDEQLPRLSALLPDALSCYDEQVVIDAVLARTNHERVTALASLNTTDTLCSTLIEQLLQHVTQALTPALHEGQVLIVVRKNLSRTPESSWLRNGVFHHVKGTSIVLGPCDATIPAPLRIAPYATLEDARRAAPLFSELAWGSVMGFEQAWQTAAALCS